jgi:hypothetical protein
VTGVPTAHDLLPLATAAESIQRKAYPERPAVKASNEYLNGLAYAIAALVPVYAISPVGEVHALTKEELAHGYFRGGAKELHFMDGRPLLNSLAITPEAVNTVVNSILAAKGP